MSNQLIPVFAGEIAGLSVQLVDARLLHSFLGSLQDFSTWIKKRIKDYQFTQGVDFITPQKNGGLKTTTYIGDRIDYHLTLDMAKELGMIERSDKGRQIRRYFLEMERVANQSKYGLKQLPEPKTKKALPGGLSLEQQDTIKSLVKQRVESMPKDKQAGEAIRCWSSIKKKFGCTYKEISPDNFVNIISLLSRIPLEGELLNKEPDPFITNSDYRSEARAAIDQHLDACHADMLAAGVTPPKWPTISDKSVDGIAASALCFHRWIASFDIETMKMKLTSIPSDAFVFSESQWIKYMTQERGYLVIKKSELLTKLEG